MFRFGICRREVHDISSAARVARTRLTVRFVFVFVVGGGRLLRASNVLWDEGTWFWIVRRVL